MRGMDVALRHRYGIRRNIELCILMDSTVDSLDNSYCLYVWRNLKAVGTGSQ